ncbi:MAG TPA: ATP-dependent Clp protease ATP-binding subunit ClpC, partial [Clostridia bacterium]|nr:ATP-dependent Clp protease ATP-binding subunit ClpC [Clostridia bacterium]
REIARRMLKILVKRVAEMDITISFDEEVIKMIADVGFDPVYGARPLRRAIQSQIEDKLSEEMLEGKLKAGKSYASKLVGDEVLFEEITN